MSAFSNHAEEKIVDTLLRGVTHVGASTVYLALFEDDPGEDGSGTETSYQDYARQPVTFGAFSGGQTKNTAPVTFPANGEAVASVTITHAAVFDALNNGNLLIKGELAADKVLAPNDVLAFAIDALALGLD